MERDLISLDLDYGKVVHIPNNPIGTETVRIREDLDKVVTDLPLGGRGNAETAHILGKFKLETRSPRKNTSAMIFR